MPYVKCQICKKEFYAKPHHLKIGWGKFCSIKCKTAAQLKKKIFQCNYCKKKIFKTPTDIKKSFSKKFFCSKSCHCSWENENRRSGENSSNWKNGQNSYRRIIQRSNIKPVCSNCGCLD